MAEQISPTDDDTDGALSIHEFCTRYRIGRTSTYEEIGAGRLIAKKRGARTLIPRASARAWLDSLPNASAPGTVAA